MSRPTQILIGILLTMCLLVFFQNCAQNKKARETPLDDTVTKISDISENDSSDDELAAEIQKLTIGENDDIALGIETCKRSMGSDRRDCIWDKIQRYFEHLKTSKGYSVPNEKANCLLAVSKTTLEHDTPLTIISACKNFDSARMHPHIIHLDECITQPTLNIQTRESSAFLNYRRSRYFEFAKSDVFYKVSARKKIEVLTKDAMSNSQFRDACQRTSPLVKTDLYKNVAVQ